MAKHEVGFTYTSNGKLVIEADSYDEAEEKAQEVLDNSGFPTGDNVIWEGGEGEVW